MRRILYMLGSLFMFRRLFGGARSRPVGYGRRPF